MKGMMGILLVYAMSGPWLVANDYTAEIANGGLRARQETRVYVRSERLFISRKKIRVEYEFLNESDTPVETLVAFPWPGYAWNAGVATYAPSMWEFLVEVDGKRVPHQTEVRATVGGKDVTKVLSDMGLHLPSFGHFDDPERSQFSALTQAQRDALVTVGALESSMDPYPTWMVHLTHHWRQVFPPHRPVRIVHEYEPMSGGASARPLSEIDTPTIERAGTLRELVERDFDARESGCPDAAFRSAFMARQAKVEQEPGVQPGMGLTFDWVRYILTTANTWKGPIREFELIVERSPGELVTFCWDGPVEKLSPTRFRATRKNFRPTRELTVYFVPAVPSR